MAKKRHQRRSAPATQSFAEALASSETGKHLYFEAQEREKARVAKEKEEQERYVTVREQAHDLLVAHVPYMWFWKKERLTRADLRKCFFDAAKSGVFKRLSKDRAAYYEAIYAMTSAHQSPKHLDRVWEALELA